MGYPIATNKATPTSLPTWAELLISVQRQALTTYHTTDMEPPVPYKWSGKKRIVPITARFLNASMQLHWSLHSGALIWHWFTHCLYKIAIHHTEWTFAIYQCNFITPQLGWSRSSVQIWSHLLPRGSILGSDLLCMIIIASTENCL